MACSRSLRDCAVVLDGYHFTTACQSLIREAARTLLVIDDYHHLSSYDCDILLNQNPGSEEYRYDGRAGLKLLGLDYALLRPEFQTPPLSVSQARALLLSLGGGNASAVLPSLVPGLSSPSLTGRTLRVIAGSMSADAIRKALGGTAARLEIVRHVDDMPALLAGTEMCISAGGSTCWELCRRGIPFLTVEIAENQRRICDWLDAHAYAPRFSAPAFTALLNDAERRTRCAAALRKLVDGRGAARVILRLREAYAMAH